MSIKLSTEQILKFISLYRECECLWNIHHAWYKNREGRDVAYRHIVKEMDIPGFGVSEVAQKIKNIRTTYKQELNKVRKSEDSPYVDVHKPKLVWFDAMDCFLRETVDSFGTVNGKLEEHFTKSMNAFNGRLKQAMNADKPEEVKTPSAHPNYKRFEPRFEEESPFGPQLVESHTPSTTRDTRECEYVRPNDTEFDIWAKSIAVQLNEMDTERALKLQLQIQSLVTKDRLLYERNKPSYPKSNDMKRKHGKYIERDAKQLCTSSSTSGEHRIQSEETVVKEEELEADCLRSVEGNMTGSDEDIDFILSPEVTLDC
nr:unnamed protein product [Callosobruchus chinensis]